MFDQNDDGSHTITLHSIARPGRTVFPQTSGILTWSRENGIEYSITFTGIYSLVGTEFYEQPQSGMRGVGRFADTQHTHPHWIAKTDDGTEVKLFGVSETPSSNSTSETGGFIMTCSFHGTALYAVVDIPSSRLLAFENSTEEDFRMFFIGYAGVRHDVRQPVAFQDQNGTITTERCSITLSASPRVSLVSANSLVKCKPSGWLAFSTAPVASDCEIGAFPEQNFVSFLNGRKVGFFWADRKLPTGTVRRTYFGSMKSFPQLNDGPVHQPLPFLGGIEIFKHGDTVLKLLPAFFEKFVQRSAVIDFGVALHPLWTAMDAVLDDRLALASVSLERTVSIWDDCRTSILQGTPLSDASIWKNKPFLKKIRAALQKAIESFLINDNSKSSLYQQAKDKLLAALGGFVDGDLCRTLTSEERTELRQVISARINNMTQIPNSANLRRPFEDLAIPLSERENKALQERNGALHGRKGLVGANLGALEVTAEYFDCIRMLLIKFVLRVCDYDGPYIDYASRPANGNFEVKNNLNIPDA